MAVELGSDIGGSFLSRASDLDWGWGSCICFSILSLVDRFVSSLERVITGRADPSVNDLLLLGVVCSSLEVLW